MKRDLIIGGVSNCPRHLKVLLELIRANPIMLGCMAYFVTATRAGA